MTMLLTKRRITLTIVVCRRCVFYPKNERFTKVNEIRKKTPRISLATCDGYEKSAIR